MQKIKELEIDLKVTIPDDYVLLERVEYLRLKENEKELDKAHWWTMADLEKRLGKSRDWIRDNILLEPAFRNILDSESGGFVVYPRTRGENWVFQASKMSEFLEDNFNEIFNKI